VKFPKGQYDVVLADPPWDYYGSPTKWAAAGKFYDLMTPEEIFNLPVGDLLTPTGALFLWATCPALDVAVNALYEWDLFFRGVAFVWVKTKMDGTPIGAQGVRPSFIKPLTEFVLIGSKQKRGRPMKLASEAISQTVFAPRREHSRKPVEVRERIEALFAGDLKKIELFSREIVPGWDHWGNERGKFRPKKKHG
jgi:N6-adenosine-specific RNA methylase IME4